MPPASPRKSSISSGNRSPPRPRYLGIEVAGSHPFPPSPHAWEAVLRSRLDRAGLADRSFRLIRSERRRAVAEVDHRTAAAARAAWSAPVGAPPDLPLIPRRTWGTLVRAKVWLREPVRTRG